MEKLELALLGLIVIGLIDAAYLALVELNTVPLLCPSTGVINCAAVASSAYAYVFGIPLAYIVLFWFIVALFLLFMVRPVKALKPVRTFWYVAGIGGMLYSVISMYAIHEICIYCTLLDVILVAIFALTVYKT